MGNFCTYIGGCEGCGGSGLSSLFKTEIGLPGCESKEKVSVPYIHVKRVCSAAGSSVAITIFVKTLRSQSVWRCRLLDCMNNSMCLQAAHSQPLHLVAGGVYVV